MAINKDYLKEVWNSVWEEGLTELEVQQRYFSKLNKELKGEDRFHLTAIKRKIEEKEKTKELIWVAEVQNLKARKWQIKNAMSIY